MTRSFKTIFYSEIFGILTGYHHQQNDLHDVKFMHKTFTKSIEKYLHDEYRDEHIMFMTMGMACEITMDMISMQP